MPHTGHPLGPPCCLASVVPGPCRILGDVSGRGPGSEGFNAAAALTVGILIFQSTLLCNSLVVAGSLCTRAYQILSVFHDVTELDGRQLEMLCSSVSGAS